LYASGEPSQTSASVRPWLPRTMSANGMSVTWNPVPKMIVSTSRSVPSPPTTECGRTSLRASGITSTFGWDTAGYHSSVGRMRLQPSS
jgi:hypothetical protein